MRRAVVIGAGFGGLASALRLAARGLQVTVVDRLNALAGAGESLFAKGRAQRAVCNLNTMRARRCSRRPSCLKSFLHYLVSA